MPRRCPGALGTPGTEFGPGEGDPRIPDFEPRLAVKAERGHLEVGGGDEVVGRGVADQLQRCDPPQGGGELGRTEKPVRAVGSGVGELQLEVNRGVDGEGGLGEIDSEEAEPALAGDVALDLKAAEHQLGVVGRIRTDVKTMGIDPEDDVQGHLGRDVRPADHIDGPETAGADKVQVGRPLELFLQPDVVLHDVIIERRRALACLSQVDISRLAVEPVQQAAQLFGIPDRLADLAHREAALAALEQARQEAGVGHRSGSQSPKRQGGGRQRIAEERQVGSEHTGDAAERRVRELKSLPEQIQVGAVDGSDVYGCVGDHVI